MDYALYIVSAPPGELGLRTHVEDRDDALRLAQAIANAEGVVVRIHGQGFHVDIEGDEHAFPELSFAERCQIVTNDVLQEMLAEVVEDHSRANQEHAIIVNEVTRRAFR